MPIITDMERTIVPVKPASDGNMGAVAVSDIVVWVILMCGTDVP